MTGRAGPLGAVLFAALVASTFAAFFVAQRIKQRPAVLSQVTFTGHFSPNGNGVRDEARISFALRSADRVDAEIVDDLGDPVRNLVRDREVAADEVVRAVWDGSDDSGEPVPDGRYRLRLLLRGQARSITAPRSISLDTTPPRPRVRRVRPQTISPDGDGRGDEAEILYSGPSGRGGAAEPVTVRIFRTGEGADAEEVARIEGRPGQRRFTWDGRVGGRPAPAGNYLAQVRVRDAAGNVGRTPATVEPGGDVEGNPGFRVRYIEASPPERPATAGERAPFRVSTDRRERYRYAIRRLGRVSPERTGSSRARGDVPLRPRVPERPGVYLLDLEYGEHRYTTPFAVRAAEPERLLVVVPAISWLGRNPTGPAETGWGSTLARDGRARVDHPIVGSGVPAGLNDRVLPVIRALDRAEVDYDVTTDLALARGEGRDFTEYRGILFPGDHRYLPAEAGERLASAVRGGVRVGLLSPESFRREIDIEGATMSRTGGRRTRDPFGERVVAERFDEPRPLEVGVDEVGLFSQVLPSFGAFRGVSRSVELPEDGTLLSSTATPSGGLATPVYRLGRGIVARLDPPGMAARARSDPDVERVVRELAAFLVRR